MNAWMKKLMAFVLVFVYSTFSVGATLHLHYCDGKFVGISLFDTSNDVCTQCGMEKHIDENNCCKDVKVTMKISDNHFSATTYFFSKNCFGITFTSIHPDTSHKSNSISVSNSNNSSPPHGYSIPLFIQFRNLRIWANYSPFNSKWLLSRLEQ